MKFVQNQNVFFQEDLLKEYKNNLKANQITVKQLLFLILGLIGLIFIEYLEIV